MPPAVRPCGRTTDAGKCSNCASDVMKHSSSSPVVSSTAPITSSPSFSRMISHESRLLRWSGTTRFTTPPVVPRATPIESGSIVVSASAFSPGSSETNSATGAPPCRFGAFAVVGTAGRSSDSSRISRPVLVIRPY